MADRIPFGLAPMGVASEAERAEAGPTFLDNLVAAMIGGIIGTPKRVIDAARAADPWNPPAVQSTDEPYVNPMKELVGETTGAALNLMGTGTAFGLARPGLSAGIFGGRLAKTADHAKLAQAEKMAAEGAGPSEIWDATGWFKGADDKWRFEIPDTAARVEPRALEPLGRLRIAEDHLKNELGSPFGIGHPKTDPALQKRALEFADDPNIAAVIPLRSYLSHDELFKAYPDLGGINLAMENNPTLKGSWDAKNNLMRTGGGPVVGQRYGKDDTVLHELQHVIQDREGFARGGNPAEFKAQETANLAARALSWKRELDAAPGATVAEKERHVIRQYGELGAPDWVPDETARRLAAKAIEYPGYEPDMQELVKLYRRDVKTTPDSPETMYRRLAGEVEARNVQARADMTPDKLRDVPPAFTQDIPNSDQIVRFGALAQPQSAARSYPIAPRGEWYGDANFQQTGGRMIDMAPDEFLARARPLEVDEASRENINLLKEHIRGGKTLDPLAFYKNGKEDGRHRAIAARELGISKVPVLVWD